MKKLLTFLSVITLVGTTMSNIIALSNYEKQENKLVRQERNIKQENLSFAMEDFRLETPVTKVTAFFLNNSDENTFVWTKTLPIGATYKFFNIEVKPNSNYWAEGRDFRYFNKSLKLPLFFRINIPLVNNTQNNKEIAEIKYFYTKFGTSFDMIDYYTVEAVNLKLTVNLEYFNNVITANFIAKATVQNTNLFSWVKTQAKFYFRIIVSENKI